ncbi:BON1-associated protein 2 [Medicago truncatula]|uniref:BON1-associated-like protein n=1 Tax=Medicago truncatula TaxID=3880 RepID=I3SZG8_MEDTR|nr:BON1-associated protein 2 [Medicago truncatula]AFK45660.1 unknown [Medicago truncatula]KEH18934.1 BON1-associated-like protein [Medicago truncatula]
MSQTIEITILSAENLQENKKAIKGNTFVMVQCDGSNNEVSTTKLDSEGGSYPTWNEKVVIDVPLHARFVTIEVKYKTRGSSNSVGIARVPVSDFVGGYVHENQLQFLSYRLWDNRVMRNGVVNISVKVKMSQQNSCSSSMSSTMNGVPVTGVPVAGNGSCSRVATGIPAVWLNYQRHI